jgi:hypothetical protein
VNYLGYRPSPEGIFTGNDKLEAVQDGEPPKKKFIKSDSLCDFVTFSYLISEVSPNKMEK